jgi:hypothetical protein
MNNNPEEGAGTPGGIAFDNKRQAELYWRQIEQLKAAAVCIRLYRNQLARQVKAVEIIKAVASSGAAQLLDVLKDVFPFAKLHKQAASLTVALELLLIDAKDEWEKIYIGKIADEVIIERRTRLKKLQVEAEHRHFPEGFAPDRKILALATTESRAYFLTIYNIEAKP